MKPPSTVLDFDEIAQSARIDDEVWQFCLDHWNWVADVLRERYDEAEVDFTIESALTKQQMSVLSRNMQMELPTEFRTVLSRYCGKLDFMWTCFDVDQSQLPGALNGMDIGGNMPIWDAGNLVEYSQAARNHDNSPWLAFRESLRDRLPFMADGSGNIFAFDMRAGKENCPIVFLSHDNDSDVHDKELAANFVDFIVRWSFLGCPGDTYYSMRPFLNKRFGRLDCNGRTATRWRRWLITGN